MIQSLFNSPLLFVLSILGLVVAITVHEFAHALAADHLGDPTPRSQGRLSLNPLSHLDPLGTVMLILAGFGWGKPVQFDPYNLEHPQRDTGLISLAGPASNLVLAVLLGFLFKTLPAGFASLLLPLIYTNIILAVFNLVPVYPLDGEKILSSLLPKHLSFEYQSIMRQYGTLILIFLILPIYGGSSAISQLISPVISLILNLII